MRPALIAAVLLLTGCEARYGAGCDERACLPASGNEHWWSTAHTCNCFSPSRAEVQPDGLIICRCPRGRERDGGKP